MLSRSMRATGSCAPRPKNCIAVPILSSKGQVLGGMSITGSTRDTDYQKLDALVPDLRAAAGAIAAARVLRIPVILDGFICSAAAACLADVTEGALDHTIAGHQSAEGAHSALLAQLGKVALLDMGVRLGEGSGGALAINILKSAVACHAGMATFAEAGVSDG